MKNYNNFILDYDYRRIYLKIIKPISDILIQEYQESNFSGKISEKKLKGSLEIVLSNLYHCHTLSNSCRSFCIRYSRNKNDYSGKRPGASAMLRTIDWLIDNQLCEGLCGFLDRKTNIGRTSRLRHTKLLYEKFIAAEKHALPHTEVEHAILVKDSEDKSILPDQSLMKDAFYEIPREGTSEYGALERINQENRNINVTHNGKVFPRKDLYRVFNNNSFGEGGRLYGEVVQSLPKAIRAELKINGEKVVELDYSGLHPRLLYNIQGRQPDGDPYQISDYPRGLIKQSFQRVLNNMSPHKAKLSIRKLLREHFPGYEGQEEIIFNEILKKHTPFLKFDVGGACQGLRLQRLDSDIAVGVMYQLAVKGIPCIGIHDSFIVREQDAKLLLETMKSEYNKAIQPEYCKTYERDRGESCPMDVWKSLSFDPVIR